MTLGHNAAMQQALVCALRARRPEIHARWEALLRVERANTPLAHPDTLVHLIDWSLDEIFLALSTPPSTRAHTLNCSCGRNPYLAYFAAGEQAMHEALVLTQSASPSLHADERDHALLGLKRVLEHIAQREIQAFCAVCQFRHLALPTGLESAQSHSHTLASMPASMPLSM